MNRKTSLHGTSAGLLTGLSFAIVGLVAAPAAAEDLTVASWGGAYQDSQREAYFKPFEKQFGVRIVEDEFSGELAKVRAMVEAGDVTWHVVDLDAYAVLQGCAEGILEPLDFAKIADRSKFIPGSITECGVGNMTYSTILAYDADRFPDGKGPSAIADLFDLERFPGKRGMRKTPIVNLEWALMADGVPADQVYDMLRTPEGVDRAFAKLETIKDEIVWWEAGAQPPQLLADGEVVMTTAYNGRIFDAAKNEGKNFRIVWDGQVQDFEFWTIAKGAPKQDLAYRFIAFASRPEVMANQSRYISYGPTHVDAIPLIDPAILKDLPTAPDNAKTALVQDVAFWADQAEELSARFNRWLVQ